MGALGTAQRLGKGHDARAAIPRRVRESFSLSRMVRNTDRKISAEKITGQNSRHGEFGYTCRAERSLVEVS